jgi:hypothetical protein
LRDINKLVHWRLLDMRTAIALDKRIPRLAVPISQ